jgi:hypothetical protein
MIPNYFVYVQSSNFQRRMVDKILCEDCNCDIPAVSFIGVFINNTVTDPFNAVTILPYSK